MVEVMRNGLLQPRFGGAVEAGSFQAEGDEDKSLEEGRLGGVKEGKNEGREVYGYRKKAEDEQRLDKRGTGENGDQPQLHSAP